MLRQRVELGLRRNPIVALIGPRQCGKTTGDRHAYFWATQSGAKLDLVLIMDNQRIGVEFKFGDAPTVTRSMQIAVQDLQLDRLLVVYPGPESGRLQDRIDRVALADLDKVLSNKSLARRKR